MNSYYNYVTLKSKKQNKTELHVKIEKENVVGILVYPSLKGYSTAATSAGRKGEMIVDNSFDKVLPSVPHISCFYISLSF